MKQRKVSSYDMNQYSLIYVIFSSMRGETRISHRERCTNSVRLFVQCSLMRLFWSWVFEPKFI